MEIAIRAFVHNDLPQMTELLNEIIEIGGTTAYLSPLTESDLESWTKRKVAHGAGIGSKLFAKTSEQMKELGFEWINASIRSDNDSGLRYYSKMGFRDWKVEPDAKLSDGRVTGKNHKRFNL